jgi:hypothetical protein
MKALRKVFRGGHFPAGLTLTLVVLFWSVGMLGGLSLLSRSRPPLDTLTWLLFTYACVVLSTVVGVWAASDLGRHLYRHLQHAPAPRKVKRRAGIIG